MTTLKQIEGLDINQLADALEMNGYRQCVGAIRAKHIDGQAFLKLTELQLTLWRLPSTEARRLWSFMLQIRQDPTQFVITSQISNKSALNVNMINNSPTSDSPVYGNSPNNATLLTDKPSIGPKPRKFQTPSEIKEAKFSTSIKQESKIVNNTINKVETVSEPNSSTLTKQESKIFKSKLENFFNEVANTSFIHQQKQSIISPKPDLKVGTTGLEYDESPDDGYLEPIQSKTESQKQEPTRSTTILRNDPGRNSYLHRSRKSYNHLENRAAVIQNEYEEQTVKQKSSAQNRPLPPVPIEMVRSSATVAVDTDDEELAEYTSVPEIDEPDVRNKKPFHRPLPPVPIEQVKQINQQQHHNKQQLNNGEDDEDLAEYTPIVENDIKSGIGLKITKPSRSPLPPLHIPVISAQKMKLKERAKLPTPDSDKDRSPDVQQLSPMLKPKIGSLSSSATLPTRSNTPKMSAGTSISATLPKPPSYLPKLPLKLPSPTDFSIKVQKEEVNIDFHEENAFPIPPVFPANNSPVAIDDDDEPPFYTEIDLAREPSYRETDRKGARRLLAGLEDGAFVIRPSRQPQYICTISIMHSTKMFNLGVEKNPEGTLAFGSVAPAFNQPQFHSIAEIITYYSLQPLYLSGESIVLKDILPRSRR